MMRIKLSLSKRGPDLDKRYAKVLRSHWRRDNLDMDGRIVDFGHAPGPSALDLLQLRRKRQLVAQLTHLVIWIGAAVLLIGVIIVVLHNFTWLGLLGGIVANHETNLFSIAMIFLTLGLLLATWRYANLTSFMLSEMRKARTYESEPLVSIYMWPWLQKRTDPQMVDDYYTEIVIRNVGKSPALDLSLYFEHCKSKPEQPLGRVGTVRLGDPDRATTLCLKPGSEITASWGFSKEEITAYSKFRGEDSGRPFVMLRLQFRDSYGRVHSVTQDYGLSGDYANLLLLVLECEFVSSPTGYRWRTEFNTSGI